MQARRYHTFGHRMMGTTPIVTSTEKRPSTMSSTAACADSHGHCSAHPRPVGLYHTRMNFSWEGSRCDTKLGRAEHNLTTSSSP